MICMYFIVTVSYRGALNSFLTVTTSPKPADTLEAVAKMEKPFGSFGTAFLDSLEKSTDPNLQEIRKRYTVYWNFGEAFRNASEGRLIMAEGRKRLDYNIRKLFTNKYGVPSMHVTKECFNSFQVAFAVPFKSIYKDALDMKMAALIEAGLTNKYMEIENDKIAKLARSNMASVSVKPLTLANYAGLLPVFSLMMFLSFVVFLIELCVYRKDNQNIIVV